jgi:hypothetical protein
MTKGTAWVVNIVACKYDPYRFEVEFSLKVIIARAIVIKAFEMTLLLKINCSCRVLTAGL